MPIDPTSTGNLNEGNVVLVHKALAQQGQGVLLTVKRQPVVGTQVRGQHQGPGGMSAAISIDSINEQRLMRSAHSGTGHKARVWDP